MKPQPSFLTTVFLHAGDEDDIFGSVLQSCQLGDLVELLIAHFSVWKHIQQTFTVVWQDLNKRSYIHMWQTHSVYRHVKRHVFCVPGYSAWRHRAHCQI